VSVTAVIVILNGGREPDVRDVVMFLVLMLLWTVDLFELHLMRCHSEPGFWAKNLLRSFGLNCCVVALQPILCSKSRDAIFQTDASQEVPSASSGQALRACSAQDDILELWVAK
jgi:hypothetical protein